MTWKTMFREAYVAKRQSKADREGEDKLFGGSTVNDAHGQLRQRVHTESSGTAPLTNQMLNSLESYLDNIAAAATQTVAKGVPLAELPASLAI